MILCPNCKHQELTGALFCSECGAQLHEYDHWTTQSFVKNHSEPASNINEPSQKTDPSASLSSASILPDETVGLLVIEANRMIHLRGHSEYTIGRITEDQPIVPDVDLSEFKAYLQGVSRLHASLKIGEQRISIRDLGSSNGTRVNGQKIVPNVDYPLKHGDAIALGKMKIQIVISLP